MIYGLNGQSLDNAYSLAGQSLDAAYSLSGVQVFDKQGGGDEPVSPWASVKWVPIGDSLSDLTLNADDYGDLPQIESNKGKKYQAYIASLLDGIEVVNYYGGGNRFAVGGTGYWRSTNFYERAVNVPSDATIVTIFGSVNDWLYRQLSEVSTFNPLSKYNSRQGIDKNGRVEWVEDPHLDTVADGTLAGYVNGTIQRVHAAAPSAKVVIIPGLYYYGAGQDYMHNVYFLYQAIVQAWHDNVSGSQDWLACETWYLDAAPVKTTESGRSRYTRSADSFVSDTSQLDYWFSGNQGSKFDSRKINNNGVTSFAEAYLYDYENANHGHWNNKYHQRYLARKFAHVLLKATGIAVTELPTSLRYVDSNGVPTDSSFNETYFNN